MQHVYTIYYLLGGRDLETAEQQLFENGYNACQQYECDYRTFDPAFGVIICRKLNEDGEFCEEMMIPAPFYMGQKMHIGVKEKHALHMKTETNVQNMMTDMINNENKNKNMPHNGVDAQ